MNQITKLSPVEALKENSRRLRGRLAEELAEGGIQVSEDAYQLLKFHGSYEQFDRDTATERKQRGEEKEYEFMVRVRMPGGRLTAAQYLALDELADSRANATLRITTRQGVQFHGVRKGDLKPAIADINHALLTTIAACGDVPRNVMTSPSPQADAAHRRLEADARMLSRELMPRSRGYYEIFLDEQPVTDSGQEEEPLFGATYLPRKFKIAIVTPDDNTADVLTNDLGFIALFEGDELVGYNVAIGGGMGLTHNRKDTFPRLADVVGFIEPDELLKAAEAVIAFQRDHGDRGDRRRARLKYVLADHGVEWVTERLAGYFGRRFDPPRPMPRFAIPELLGWHPQGDGRFWYGVPVPSGRIGDLGEMTLRSALREIVQRHGADPIMTPQQDVLLSNLPESAHGDVEATLRRHGVTLVGDLSPLARWTLACPALPTCGLALTEAERVRQPIIESIEVVLGELGLGEELISLRITGCPNGCVRTYVGDIGLVGRMPGRYALYVGGDFEGTIMSFRLLDRVDEGDIATVLRPLLARYATDRQPGEAFGPWCTRQGLDALLALLPPERRPAPGKAA